MTVFAPNKKNSSCQEMGGQYLRCCSMGKLVLGTGYWILGIGYWILGTWYWVLGSKFRVQGSRFKVQGCPAAAS